MAVKVYAGPPQLSCFLMALKRKGEKLLLNNSQQKERQKVS